MARLLGVGATHAYAFLLNANGLPAATSTTPYGGIRLYGAQSFTLNIPEPQRITHYGDTHVLAVDYLPPREGSTAELRVAVNDSQAIATLTGVSVADVGGADAVPLGTDRQGSEPTVGIVISQQTLNQDTGVRYWRTIVIPRARMIPVPPSLDDNPAAVTFRCALSPSRYHLWGAELDVATDGASQATIVEMHSAGRVKLLAYQGDGSTTTFDLDDDFPIVDEGSGVVWVNGTEVSATFSETNNNFTLSSAPSNGSIIVVKYEW